MSLVGPRPLPVYETEAFTSDAHRRRLSVLPGVTGYWQIAGRSNIREFEKLVELDMKYIDNWSLWLDIKLLLKTVRQCFSPVGQSSFLVSLDCRPSAVIAGNLESGWGSLSGGTGLF